MEDGLIISNLPDWRYAGKKAESVVTNRHYDRSGKPITPPEEGEQTAIMMHPVTVIGKGGKRSQSYEKREYIIENGYMIPKYNATDPSLRRRGETLLVKRKKQFFYACEPGLDVDRTGDEIQREIALFHKKLQILNTEKEAAGELPFNLSTDIHDMSSKERELRVIGAQCAGHAVKRLYNLGCVILQGNRDNVEFEYDDAYIAAHKKDIMLEFYNLYKQIAHDEEQLVRCVMTRDLKQDHDGIFSDLIRELGKPVLPLIYDGDLPESAVPPFETSTRHNIVSKIGYTLAAIDEVDAAMQQISQSPLFSALIDKAVEKENEQMRPIGLGSSRSHPRISGREVNSSDYRGLMTEYVALCRARACIKSKDADNYNPVAARLRFLQIELGMHHEALYKSSSTAVVNKSYHDIDAEQAITMLKRGMTLMGEMAELRMPRNRNAQVYDRDLPEFKGRDASSVGRYVEEVNALAETLSETRGVSAKRFSKGTSKPAEWSK